MADEKYAEIMSGQCPPGHWSSGSTHHSAIGLDKVQRIHDALEAGHTILQIAIETGADRSTIGEVKAGRHWSCKLGGRFARPEKPPQVQIKLTVEQAKEIRRRRAAGERGVALAREFGVSPATISLINTRKSWNRG